MRLSTLTFAALISASTLVLAGPATEPVIDLTPGNMPGITAAAAVDSVREGTHFVSRTGRLMHTTDGQQAIFVFDNDSSTSKSPPMLVLQNLNLLMMENVTTSRETMPTFRISGTVTEYKGRNYILIDDTQTTLLRATQAKGKNADVDPLPKETPTPPTQTATSKATTAKTNGISPDQMMNHLLDSPPQAGTPIRNSIAATSIGDITTGQAAVAPNAPVIKTKREGTHLIDRMGRLNHSPDGQQATFTFDSDGKAMQDAPLIIMPNLKLSAMEGAVSTKSMDVHFRISGTVTEYKGRNYILLDKAVAMADVELPF